MTVEQLKERYKVIEAKRINDDIVCVDLYHDETKSCLYHIKLLFAYNKLYYTGDFGTYVFGETICNIFNFFKGERINKEYWKEKCEAARDLIIPDEVNLNKLEKAIYEEFEEREIEITDDIDNKISNCLYYMDSNAVRAYDRIGELFDDLGISNAGEIAYDVVRVARGYSVRFVYACEVIQWVSNNLDEWLEEK